MLKRIICALLSLCMAFCLTSCKNGSSNDSNYSTGEETVENKTEQMKNQLDFGGEKITIMYEWEPFADGQNTAANNLIKEIEKKFNVEIIQKKWIVPLLGEVLAGIEPEGHLYSISYTGGGNIIDLALKGHLASLNAAMKATGITMEEEFYNEFHTQQGNINGKQWAIGVGFPRINAAVLYNKKMVNAAGYDIQKLIDKNEWTWAKMTEIGKKLTKRNASGEVTQWGIGIGQTGIKALILSNGGNIVYPDDTGKFVSKLDSQNVQEALQLAYNWYNVDKIANSFSGGQWIRGDLAFAQNKVAMYVTGHTGIDTAYNSLSGDDYGVAYLPMGPKMDKYVSYMVGDYSYVIPASYQNMTTQLLLLVDELQQGSMKNSTSEELFCDEWANRFHTKEQLKIWCNMHFSNNIVHCWDGLDLISTTFKGSGAISLNAIIKGSKSPNAWISANHNTYNLITQNNSKTITYTGKLK